MGIVLCTQQVNFSTTDTLLLCNIVLYVGASFFVHWVWCCYFMGWGGTYLQFFTNQMFMHQNYISVYLLTMSMCIRGHTLPPLLGVKQMIINYMKEL